MSERKIEWGEFDASLVGKTVRIVFPQDEPAMREVAGVVSIFCMMNNGPIIRLADDGGEHVIVPPQKAMFSSKVTPYHPTVYVME